MPSNWTSRAQNRWFHHVGLWTAAMVTVSVCCCSCVRSSTTYRIILDRELLPGREYVFHFQHRCFLRRIPRNAADNLPKGHAAAEKELQRLDTTFSYTSLESGTNGVRLAELDIEMLDFSVEGQPVSNALTGAAVAVSWNSNRVSFVRSDGQELSPVEQQALRLFMRPREVMSRDSLEGTSRSIRRGESWDIDKAGTAESVMSHLGYRARLAAESVDGKSTLVSVEDDLLEVRSNVLITGLEKDAAFQVLPMRADRIEIEGVTTYILPTDLTRPVQKTSMRTEMRLMLPADSPVERVDSIVEQISALLSQK